MQTLYLIDASGFIFRAFYALPPLTRLDGVPVGAVYGFCNMLFKLRDMILERSSIEEALWAAVFDVARQNFRHKIDPNYKSNRKETPPDLIPQFALIREATEAFDCPVIEQAGFEADDVIASLSKKADERGIHVVIISSDKDLMQLYRPNIELFDPMKQRWITETLIQEKFGVGPEQVVDVQALAGDASDGVKGVPGIGVKTAAELIKAFGSLEILLSNAQSIPQKKRQALILQHADSARMAKQLVSLRSDVEVDLKDYQLAFPRNFLKTQKQQMLNFFERQGFVGLVRKMKTMLSESSTPVKVLSVASGKKFEIMNREDWEKVSAQFELESKMSQTLSFVLVRYPEKDGDFRIDGGVIGLISHDVLYNLVFNMLDKADQRVIFNRLLTNHHIIAYDIKSIWHEVQRPLDSVNQFEDVQLMAYALLGGRSPPSLSTLLQQFLEVNDEDESSKTPIEQAAFEASLLQPLMSVLSERFEQAPELQRTYQKIDHPVVWPVYVMERNGVRINAEALQNFSQYLDSSIAELETLIHALAGKDFNLASPQQLGKVLFEDLGIVSFKKSKTGQYQTDSAVLSEIARRGDVPIVELILKWRQLFKLRSTYIESLIQCIHPETQRVHPTFLLTHTNTGRLACSRPNLQNIPIRTPEGEKIREAFIGEEGLCLASFDYSQIELRLLAYMGQVKGLIKVFEEGGDVHKTTAAMIFNKKLEEIDPLLRRQAKAVNFGIIYGQSQYGLAQQLKISNKEASDIIKAYFQTYPEIKAYIQSCQEFAHKQGYVETLFKRRCYVSSINDKNYALRQFAERQAINAPLQGTNADIIKIAMTRINEALQNDPAVQLVLQIHDELLFEGTHQALQARASKIQEIMEGVLKEPNMLKVPLVVNFRIGKTWAEAH